MQHTETNLKKPLVGFGSQVKMGPKNTQEKLHYQILCNMQTQYTHGKGDCLFKTHDHFERPRENFSKEVPGITFLSCMQTQRGIVDVLIADLSLVFFMSFPGFVVFTVVVSCVFENRHDETNITCFNIHLWLLKKRLWLIELSFYKSKLDFDKGVLFQIQISLCKEIIFIIRNYK